MVAWKFNMNLCGLLEKTDDSDTGCHGIVAHLKSY
jgi:hypothetical protein